MDKRRDSAKALRKGLEILEALAGDCRELGLSELAKTLDFKKPTAHRLVTTLETHGYLERNPATGRYRLGLKVWRLGHHVVNQLRLREVARPFLEALGAETQEHVNLAVLDGHDAVFVDIIESSKPIRPYTYVGGRVPSYCSATGKAMLAFQRDEVLAAVIEGGLKPFTDRTIVNASRLRDDLRTVRRRGYAINREEWREDVCGLAAPVRDHSAEVVGSVSITTPTSRFDEQAFRSAVLAAARGISRAMGWIEEDSSRDARTTARRHGRAAAQVDRGRASDGRRPTNHRCRAGMASGDALAIVRRRSEGRSP